MIKPTVLALLLLCTQLTSGKRLKTTKTDALEASSWDVFACDTMCMQCPDGKNVLIQRQKSTAATVSSVVAGAFTLGVGFPVVNQLSGCSKIGFEFWQDRKLLEDQELQTDSWFGMLPNSGLEKMQKMVDLKTSDEDMQALKQCERLSDAYLWLAVRGAFSMENPDNAQQDFARACLAHSALCGPSVELGESMNTSSELKVARFNPFAHEEMCSAPHNSVEMQDKSSPKASGLSSESWGENRKLPARGPHHTTKTSGSSTIGGLPAGLKPSAGQLPESAMKEAGVDKVEGDADTLIYKVEEEELNEQDLDAEMSDKTLPKVSNKDAAPETIADREETEQILTKENLATDADLSANTVVEAGKVLEKLKRAQDAEEELERSQTAEEKLKRAQHEAAGGAPSIAQWGKDTAAVRNFLIGGYCRSKDQAKLCKKSGVMTSQCKDRCCLDVCHFYENRPSCVSGCVKHFGHDEAEYHRLMAVIS